MKEFKDEKRMNDRMTAEAYSGFGAEGSLKMWPKCKFFC